MEGCLDFRMDEAHEVEPCTRANMEHIRQSRPDSGLDSEVKGLKNFEVVPSSLRSGTKWCLAFRLIEAHEVEERVSGLGFGVGVWGVGVGDWDLRGWGLGFGVWGWGLGVVGWGL